MEGERHTCCLPGPLDLAMSHQSEVADMDDEGSNLQPGRCLDEAES